MPARSICFALLIALSHSVLAQDGPATTPAGDLPASPVSGEAPPAWEALFRVIGIALPESAATVLAQPEAQSPAERLAQRRTQIETLAEQNLLRRAQLVALSESVRERDAELARRATEQAELSEQLDRLEALMNRDGS